MTGNCVQVYESIISNVIQKDLCLIFENLGNFRNKIVEKSSAGQGAGDAFPGQATGDPSLSVLSG